MNQVSNLQRPGQPHVHQGAQPSRFPPSAPGSVPVYTPQPSHPQYTYSGQNHGTMGIPPNAQFMVAPPYGYGQPQFQPYAPVAMIPHQYGQPVYAHPLQQHQFAMPFAVPMPQCMPPPPPVAANPPPQKRAKKIMSILNPETHAAVDLPHTEKPSISEEAQTSEVAPTAEQDLKPIGSGRPTLQASTSTAGGQKGKALAMEHPKVVEFSSNEEAEKKTAAEKKDEAKPDLPETSPPAGHSSILHFVDPKTHAAVELPKASPSPTNRAPVFEIPHAFAFPSYAMPQAQTYVFQENITQRSESDSKLDNETLSLETLEKKLEEFKTEDADDLEKLVYNRSFIQLLREIIEISGVEPCPLSEEKLKEIGIDRKTMPAPANVTHQASKNKYAGARGGNFNLSWQPKPQQKNPFATNPKKNKDKSGSQNRKPVEKPVSILEKSENAWKADCMNKNKSNPWNRNKISEETVPEKIEKVRKDIRGLLNKITPTTYEELSQQLVTKSVWDDLDTLPTVVELIFIKAVEEPTFVEIYSNLCLAVHQAEDRSDEEKKRKPKRSFHGAIVRKCQDSFEALSQAQESIQKIEEEIKAEDAKEEKDQKKLEDLRERLEDLKAKEKRRMLGTIRFISHLFRIGLLNFKVMNHCLSVLTGKAEKDKDELAVEYGVELMKQVGPHVAAKIPDMVPQFNQSVVRYNIFKPDVSNRVKFMIMDLAALRNKNWKKKEEGPKTMKEVEMDVVKEEQQNQRDREVYEYVTSRASSKANNSFGRQRQGYQSRPPLVDKKDREHTAYYASQNVPTSTWKRDVSLSKVVQPDRLGVPKKTWGAPAQAASEPQSLDTIMEEEKNQPLNDEAKSSSQQMQHSHQPLNDGAKSGSRQMQQPRQSLNDREKPGSRHTPKDGSKQGGRQTRQFPSDRAKSGGLQIQQSRRPSNDRAKSGGHQVQQSRQASNDRSGGRQMQQSHQTPKDKTKFGSSHKNTHPFPGEKMQILKRPDSATATSSSHSQINSPTYTSEDQYDKGEFKKKFKECLDSIMKDEPIVEVVKSLVELNTQLNNPVVFFKEMCKYCCEFLKKDEEKERHAVARLILQGCTQEPGLKKSFSSGFQQYCNYVVKTEVEEDVPHLKITLPQLVAHILTDPQNKEIQNKDFIAGFKEFDEGKDPKPMFGFFLVEYGAILGTRSGDDIGPIVSMAVAEFADIDPHYKSEQMQELFKEVKIKNEDYKNLKELLDANP